jgi:DNA-binding response OmpR family regulator
VRVLVIEDDQELAETVAAGLRRERMAVDVALDGTAGLARALVNDYGVIVLDRDLPGLHGDQVCARLVDGGGRSRVLMLTAAASSDDLVDGLGLGTDDYLPKPLDFPVLVARIAALARRAQPSIPPLLESGDVVLDAAKRRATDDERPAGFAPKSLLAHVTQPGGVGWGGGLMLVVNFRVWCGPLEFPSQFFESSARMSMRESWGCSMPL